MTRYGSKPKLESLEGLGFWFWFVEGFSNVTYIVIDLWDEDSITVVDILTKVFITVIVIPIMYVAGSIYMGFLGKWLVKRNSLNGRQSAFYSKKGIEYFKMLERISGEYAEQESNVGED